MILFHNVYDWKGSPKFANSSFLLLRWYTEVRFASFLSGGFITAIVVKPPERKLAKRTSMECINGII